MKQDRDIADSKSARYSTVNATLKIMKNLEETLGEVCWS